MKIICLTNFYPPASRGGYEEWCQEVATGLHARGHAVTVLTSRHGAQAAAAADPTWVHRELHLEMTLASLRNGVAFFTHRHQREQANLDQLRQLVAQGQPDVILIWGMWNLPRSLAALAETLRPGRVIYYMGDYWPSLPSQHQFYWQAPARTFATAVPKALLGSIARRLLAREQPAALRFDHVLFPSCWMRDEFMRMGIAMRQSTVIYGAINTEPYRCCTRPLSRHRTESLSLLYVGRLTADKGVHTAIEAVGRLVRRERFHSLRLQIVGTGEAAYIERLHALSKAEGVADLVHFAGPQPKAALLQFYQAADIFLFTSIWQEPFGRVLVEAMAAGLPVVGATSGGAVEILQDGENGLTYTPGDAVGLATQLVRLIESPTLRQQLAATGRRTALEKFDVSRMVAEIELYLQRASLRF